MREGSRTTQMDRAVSDYRRGMSAKLAARNHGVSRSQLYRHLQFCNLLRTGQARYRPRALDLTEQEILDAAWRIRQTWTESETQRRYVGHAAVLGRLTRVFTGIVRKMDESEAA